MQISEVAAIHGDDAHIIVGGATWTVTATTRPTPGLTRIPLMSYVTGACDRSNSQILLISDAVLKFFQDT